MCSIIVSLSLGLRFHLKITKGLAFDIPKAEDLSVAINFPSLSKFSLSEREKKLFFAPPANKRHLRPT